MKQKANCDSSAFTRVELVVVIAIVLVLVAMLVPSTCKPLKAYAPRAICMGNLQKLGIAVRDWDQPGGGPPNALVKADQSLDFWTNPVIVSKLSSTKDLICPTDERLPAMDFKTDLRDTSHVSYFVGANASDVYPQFIAAGDRNLGPGAVPGPDYGYSSTNGHGNDVAVPISGPVSWSLKMHSAGNTAGAGNILLGDGSAQQTSSASFNSNILSKSNPTTNWPVGHVPSVPSVRLVFP